MVNREGAAEIVPGCHFSYAGERHVLRIAVGLIVRILYHDLDRIRGPVAEKIFK